MSCFRHLTSDYRRGSRNLLISKLATGDDPKPVLTVSNPHNLSKIRVNVIFPSPFSAFEEIYPLKSYVHFISLP